MYSNVFIDFKCYYINAFKYEKHGRAMCGILVCVHNSISKYVVRIDSECKFCIFFKISNVLFKTEKDIVLCIVYLPPYNSPAYRFENSWGIELIEHYLNEMQLDLSSIDLVIMGDLNARTGTSNEYVDIGHNIPEFNEYEDIFSNTGCPRKSCDSVVNRAGEMLLDFCKVYGLFIANGRCGKDFDIGQYTFTNSNGSSLIDYLIVPEHLITHITEFEIGLRTESCHFPVVVNFTSDYKIPEEIATDNNPNERASFIFNDANIHILRETALNLTQNEAINMINNSQISIDQVLQSVMNLINESINCCKVSKVNRAKLKQPAWFDRECLDLKKMKIKCLRQYRLERSNDKLNKYVSTRNKFKEMCDRKKRSLFEQELNDLIDSSQNPKSFWKKLKRFTSTPTTKNNIPINQWQDHFERLFSGELVEARETAISDDDDIDDVLDEICNGVITEEEIAMSIRDLKCNKAPGQDEIPPLFFKHTHDIFMPMFVRLFNRLFNNGEFPLAWSSAIIVPLHKKGDINTPTNYRGISLLDIFGKIYTSVINRRLSFFANMYDLIDESQAGFRSGYSTIDNAFVLQSIISKLLSKKRGKLYVAFIDFKTAFDSVHRGKLWSILANANVKGKLFKSITGMYNNVRACVRANGTLSDYFNCPVGLKQGCLASPKLFSLFINELAHIMQSSDDIKGIQILPNDIEILLLMFADDVALLSDTICGLQRKLNILKDFSDDSCLTVNIQKTKIMVFKRGGRPAYNEHWTYDGANIEVVQSFTYVGVTFTSRLSLNEMAKDLALKGKRALLAILSSMYKYGQLPHHVYFKIFDTKISPILLYGSELWGFQARESTELINRYACKRFLCVYNRSTNAAVLGDCGRYPLWIESARRCLKYWFKILKMPNNRYVLKCYNMLKTMTNNCYGNWTNEVESMLSENGFRYVWLNQGVDNEKLFLVNFANRLKDRYLQEWYNTLETSNKLSVYNNIKSCYEKAAYISILRVRKFRHCYAQFRTGVHNLEIEKGRYTNTPRNERLCKVCSLNQVEDELHFVLVCPAYSDLRLQYIPSKYLINTSIHKLYVLLANRNEKCIKNVATYICHAMFKRKTLLDI